MPPRPPQHIAVLGGGITGLTAAFHLTRRFPTARVTLIEKSRTLGGWVRSERVCVDQATNTTVLLEAGPRTLRPGSKGLTELINLLGLTSQVVTTPRQASAAKRRHLHLPPDRGLVELPSSLLDLLRPSPLRGLLVPAVLRDAIRIPRRRKRQSPSDKDKETGDESVHAFLSRAFGDEVARVLGSSVVHGIYAADSRLVSVRAAFGSVWHAAADVGRGSVIRGVLWRSSGTSYHKTDVEDIGDNPYQLGEVEEVLRDAAVFSFRDGVSAITEALERSLRGREGVSIQSNVEVASFCYNRDTEMFEIRTKEDDQLFATHVVSALPLSTLSSILPRSEQPIPHLNANPSSSVTVVNLVFPMALSSRIHPDSYGYLVPRPPAGYASHHGQNQEVGDNEGSGMLGCVFDSCAISGQDTGVPHVKLTGMFGGPHPPCPLSISGILLRLQHQLALPDPLPVPVVHRMHEHQECIPVPLVGHLSRVKEMRKAFASEAWGSGRFVVVGAGVDGVSVEDCIVSGRHAGVRWS